MKAVFLVFVPLLFASAMAFHLPGHGKHPKHAKKSGGKRVLASDQDVHEQGGDIDLSTLLGGGGGGLGAGGGDLGGMGGAGDLGGAGGARALRGLGDEQEGTAEMYDNDEVVVAGGRVVRGGVAVARPGYRGPFY
ncbi:uncharacterized protein IUM83_14249 [Phytophthora cinnamomi]|uniref:uncharacterized protein n=1 Tax=Phytophthora cinnamomi TaxID=4785 RepID=UPI00355A17A3|nr:hypothetical protein IUM83_14249 [Phytophthora cinnamomi]